MNDENRVQEECILRLNHLDLSGKYSCEGSQSNGMLVSSEQAEIEVIGIELAEISATKLHRGSDGFVEIRVSGLKSVNFTRIFRLVLIQNQKFFGSYQTRSF